MMMFVNAFAVCGLISLAGQLIYDNTKLTAGHITSMFVVIGAALDTFGLYDKLIEFAGAGASLPITSFGHSLIHGALAQAQENGLSPVKFFKGMMPAILFAFLAAVVFKPKS